MPGAVLVRAEEIWASYRRLLRRSTVLNGVSLTVEPGEIVAVAGPNGAGKTTLLRVLVGLKRPDQGRCTIAGRPPGAYRRRQGCGYLPESLAFPRAWTCRDVLGRSADMAASPAERAGVFERSVSRSGFDAATLDKPARLCSKGTRRRLGLVHALAGEPDFDQRQHELAVRLQVFPDSSFGERYCFVGSVDHVLQPMPVILLHIGLPLDPPRSA